MKHIYDSQNGNHNNKSVEERFTERFKEVVQNYESTFEPADWSAMQSKLAIYNDKDRKKVVFRRLAYFMAMGAVAIILLFGGYQFLDNSVNKISKQTLDRTIVFQENSIQENGLQSSELNSNLNKQSNNAITSIGKTTTQNDLREKSIPQVDKKVEQQVVRKTEESQKTLASQSFTKTKPSSNSKSKGKAKQNNQLVTSYSFDAGKEVQLIDITLAQNLEKTNSIQEAESNKMLNVLKIEKQNFDLFAHVKPKEIKLPKLEIDEIVVASDNQTDQNEELIRKNPVVSAVGKWRIGATLMAMTNIYKSNNKQRMNYANGYGVIADYQVAKRFNVSTGAIYTQKRIDIEEPSFIPTITNNPNSPNSIDEAWVKKNKTQISWQLLDLPIHVRYNTIQTQRNKWYVSAGISNYFFLKENYESDYTVSFQDTYDPRLTRTQEVVRQRETQSALQLFATINVSVGLETSLGKHLTLQVEPYWRFPVRSLGSEGVFVQTGGLLTRINFAL